MAAEYDYYAAFDADITLILRLLQAYIKIILLGVPCEKKMHSQKRMILYETIYPATNKSEMLTG